MLPALLVSLLAATANVMAQDAHPRGARAAAARVMSLAATGPRSSPFAPPDKDVFVTDASPGLDTGCVFNDNPANPLTIDIPVDRFVGDVDANGYLVNPALLVAAGIIPNAVDIVFPAYDVDFNGTPPPERDVFSFNGQALGFMTGENDVWKLNTFRVDIRKVKFPQRPAPGAAPVPAMNRIQVQIDTLASSRWCTQIDWAALVLPIRPKLGLDLEVIAGNPMRSNAGAAITKIQQQTFDASCNLSTTIGPIDQYPFSGPSLTGAGSTGEASLRATIKACPEGSLKPPEVTADWAVAGSPQHGTLQWSGLEGTVAYRMPTAVGSYDATLKLTLDNGQVIDATRRLYVTHKAPLIADPLLNWYDKGTAWASGETTETPIITRVLSGLYGYGAAQWRYGYFGPAAAPKCSWQQLMNNPISCNYSDCYVFSDVLENISATLGVGGLAPIQQFGRDGSTSMFLTTGSPSLDPAFRGNARPLGISTFDRYLFSSHSLRLRSGTYYDATFNGRYGSSTAFIAANTNGTTGSDAGGNFYGTYEGRRIYPRPGSGYDSWGINDYAFLTFSPFKPLAAAGAGGMSPNAAAAALLAFPGSARFRPIDADGNGRYEALEVDVDVDVAVAGDYVVFGRLQSSGGLDVANRPAFESMLMTRADISGAPGRRTITLRFSGEQIRQSHLDGPYTLVLTANSPNAAAGSGTLATPPYRASDFGERKAELKSLIPSPVDSDGSGKFDRISVSLDIDAAVAGPYQLQVSIVGGGSSLASLTRSLTLAAGAQTITLNLPATGIARSGINAPYDVSVKLNDATGASIDGASVPLVNYLASQFEGVVDVVPPLIEQRVDSNANGLVDVLRVTAAVKARAPRNAIVNATLVGANGASIAVDAAASLTAGTQNVSFGFSGPQLRRNQMDSVYQLDLSFRDPLNLQEFDALRLPLQGVYLYSQFDPAEAPLAIALTGARSDRGIDTNGNGKFDLLHVELGVQLANAGSYDWSARLVDRNGIEIDFAAGSANLPAGSGTISLEFDGKAIAANGFDGPYAIKSLLMSNSNGASLVSTQAANTSAWKANQFEGFVVRVPGDLNGDGVVDSKDVAAFNLAFGSVAGEPNYNRFADFDRDGRITLNDLRLFRSYLPR